MKTMKNFYAILAFEKVAILKSYSKAALELGVSKAHISKLIQELEDNLGQRLFHRSTRVVKLTQMGEMFFEKCHHSLKNIEFAQKEILDSADLPKGNLKISLAGAFGEEFIAPFICDFLKRYPTLTVELSFEEKIINLVKEGFDLAIRVGHLEDSSLIAKKIATRKEYLCATPDFIERFGMPSSLQDLKNYNCLLTNSDQWNFITKTIKVNGNFKSNNGRAVLNATLSGLGISRLPGVYVNRYLSEGKLIKILDEYMPEEIPIWAITPTKKNMSTGVRLFLEEIENRFKGFY